MSVARIPVAEEVSSVLKLFAVMISMNIVVVIGKVVFESGNHPMKAYCRESSGLVL